MHHKIANKHMLHTVYVLHNVYTVAKGSGAHQPCAGLGILAMTYRRHMAVECNEARSQALQSLSVQVKMKIGLWIVPSLECHPVAKTW